MDFPLFQFPSASPLTFGLLSSAYLRNGNVDHQVCSVPKLSVVNEWHQVAPRARILDRVIASKDPKKIVNAMVDYYHANYMKELVPFSILSDLVKDDILQVQLFDQYDPYAGNALYVHLFENGSQFWMYAGEFAYYTDGIFDPSVVKCVEFNSPIRQITGVHAIRHLVAVRTWDGVTFLEVEKNEYHLNLNMLDSHRFLKQPLHIEWHHVLFGRAIIRLEGGPCYIWDISCSLSDRLKCIFDQSSRADSIYLSWKSCIFGSHPKTVILADPHNLELLDTRDKNAPSRLLEVNDTQLYSIAKDPLNCFHIALATKDTTDLMDLRFLKSPILKMKFQDNRDIYIDLKFIHTDKRYISGWDPQRGNTMLYELDSHEKCEYFPPCLRSVQNLAPFKDHLAKDLLPFLPKRPKHHLALREDESHPNWPKLAGCAPVLSKNDNLFLHHLYEDGSIYSITYTSSTEADELIIHPYINTDFIKQQESIIFREFMETPDLYQDSKCLKLKQHKVSLKKEKGKNVKTKSLSISSSDPPIVIETAQLSTIQEYYFERWNNIDQSQAMSFQSLNDRKRTHSENTPSVSVVPETQTEETVPNVVKSFESQGSIVSIESKASSSIEKPKKVEKSKRRKGF